MSRIYRPLFALVFLAALISFLGCSHSRPYFRESGPHAVPSPTGDVQHRLILVGDAGKARRETTGAAGPILRALTRQAGQLPDRTSVVFLGDNVYEDGVPDEKEPEKHSLAMLHLDAQLNILKQSGARGYFVPGNHDWRSGRHGGRAAVLRQEQAIQNRGGGLAEQVPASGCPGPAKIDVDGLRIIAVDTQWWLHPPEDRGAESCWPDADPPQGQREMDAKAQFADSLAQLISTAGTREIIVVAHHPPMSHGPHGGFYDWKMYLLPFPLVLPFAKKVLRIGAHQDQSGRDYQQMLALFLRAFAKSRQPLVIAGGHEHSLQVMDGGAWADFVLVSGAGSRGKVTPVSHGPETRFALSQAGFMAIDYINDGRVVLQVFTVDKSTGTASTVYTLRLK